MTDRSNESSNTEFSKAIIEVKKEMNEIEVRSKRKLNLMERYLFKNIFRAGNLTVEQLEDYIDRKADTLIEILRQSADKLENGNMITKFILFAVIVSTIISLSSLIVMVNILLHIK